MQTSLLGIANKAKQDKNLNEMVEDLKNKRYKAKLVKRVYIPKSNSG